MEESGCRGTPHLFQAVFQFSSLPIAEENLDTNANLAMDIGVVVLGQTSVLTAQPLSRVFYFYQMPNDGM
ncbi:hypothetical protein ABH19_02495 [Leptospirillum sp. Group II 'CF-1']|nr:hypothetical protein ABH19_02495 [Leptospirillum sp. Group II 'CF-1']